MSDKEEKPENKPTHSGKPTYREAYNNEDSKRSENTPSKDQG
jgi:hypothetical protein